MATTAVVVTVVALFPSVCRFTPAEVVAYWTEKVSAVLSTPASASVISAISRVLWVRVAALWVGETIVMLGFVVSTVALAVRAVPASSYVTVISAPVTVAIVGRTRPCGNAFSATVVDAAVAASV